MRRRRTTCHVTSTGWDWSSLLTQHSVSCTSSRTLTRSEFYAVRSTSACVSSHSETNSVPLPTIKRLDSSSEIPSHTCAAEPPSNSTDGRTTSGCSSYTVDGSITVTTLDLRSRYRWFDSRSLSLSNGYYVTWMIVCI